MEKKGRAALAARLFALREEKQGKKDGP